MVGREYHNCLPQKTVGLKSVSEGELIFETPRRWFSPILVGTQTSTVVVYYPMFSLLKSKVVVTGTKENLAQYYTQRAKLPVGGIAILQVCRSE